MWALQFNHSKADDVIICRGFTRALPTGRLKSFADYFRKPHCPEWCDMIAKPLQTTLVNAFPDLLPPLPPLVPPSPVPSVSMPTRPPPIPGLEATQEVTQAKEEAAAELSMSPREALEHFKRWWPN